MVIGYDLIIFKVTKMSAILMMTKMTRKKVRGKLHARSVLRTPYEIHSRKQAHRPETTLAKSFATLQLKKFDLEFTVDPLFKKTSADFDEGGAMGLLMNHLGVDGRGRVVFDAGDAGGIEEEEEEEAVDEVVDLSKLRGKSSSKQQSLTGQSSFHQPKISWSTQFPILLVASVSRRTLTTCLIYRHLL